MSKMMVLLSMILFFQACSKTNINYNKSYDEIFSKEYFNPEWKKQGISAEEWYYRMTVIDAPMNSQALGIAEGHVFHPDVIRWEITKNMLIAWRAHASIEGYDLENYPGMRDNYRGAPVLAFFIYSHFDKIGDLRDTTLPWYERQYMEVDWSRNIVSQIKRHDTQEGVGSDSLDSRSEYYIDNAWVGNPNRIRIDAQNIDFTIRHPIEVSAQASNGSYGRVFKGDTAAPVIDIRHSFLKKSKSDFLPLPSPNEVIELSGSTIRKIPINNRIGLFRTGFDGIPVYDRNTGLVAQGGITNATIFNIWKKSVDEQGKIIPMQNREVKPIIYYTNVLHPNDLLDTSKRAVKAWDDAFRSALLYAQSNKYKTLDSVPAVFILKENSCNLSTITTILSSFSSDSIDTIERAARVSLSEVSSNFHRADETKDYNQRFQEEIKAKRLLEQICSALEFYTKDSSSPFIYQRPGDLRFNLINLLVDNTTTRWSGYGPMLSDPITGETISATANVNLKYIDTSAQKLAKKISFLKAHYPQLPSIFSSIQVNKNDLLPEDEAIKSMNERLLALGQKSTSHNVVRAFRALDVFPHAGLNEEELNQLQLAKHPDHAQAANNEKSTSHHHRFLALSTPSMEKRNSLMDPASFVDSISTSRAMKYFHDSEEEGFIKIREMIYESVILHELGHNLGLMHNMAASSDALNYGDDFWAIEQLPDDIEEALKKTHDKTIIKKLKACLNNAQQLNSSVGISLYQDSTTKDCLEQKNAMYSSIMDYHATMGGIKGLGLYDKAAIKWAYTQLVEVFPRENIALDINSTTMKEWIKYNDYRQIPGELFNNYEALNKRTYEKFEWDNVAAKSEFPLNAVPYAYCDDAVGAVGPKCLAFDFGPDMRSAAKWLTSQFWTNYLFNYFAKDESLEGQSLAIKSLEKDIESIDRFSLMMRWYHYYMKNDPKFAGSFLEKDYLSALAMGINHLAHIIALPEPGAHISAPMWSSEHNQLSNDFSKRTAASNILIPLNQLDYCAAQSISTIDAQGHMKGRGDYKLVEVPLGIGRPFSSKSITTIDDNYIVYVGTSLLKKYALQQLVAPLGADKSFAHIEHRDLLSLSWYQIFPQAVSLIYNSVINEKPKDIGFIVDTHGEIIVRSIIDERSLKLIDYQNINIVAPFIDKNIVLFALINAVAFIPSVAEIDDKFVQSIPVYCKGCKDDIHYSEPNAEYEISNYTHLTGHSFQALKFRETSLGANLLAKAQYQKDHFLLLSQCVNDEAIRNSHPICQCIKTIERRSSDEWLCCDESNPQCSQPTLEPIGSESCSMAILEERRDRAKDQLNETVGLIHQLRQLIVQAE